MCRYKIETIKNKKVAVVHDCTVRLHIPHDIPQVISVCRSSNSLTYSSLPPLSTGTPGARPATNTTLHAVSARPPNPHVRNQLHYTNSQLQPLQLCESGVSKSAVTDACALLCAAAWTLSAAAAGRGRPCAPLAVPVASRAGLTGDSPHLRFQMVRSSHVKKSAGTCSCSSRANFCLSSIWNALLALTPTSGAEPTSATIASSRSPT